MGILAWIVLGLAAGWIASLITNTNKTQGVAEDILLGVLGAVVAGLATSLFGQTAVTGLNLTSLAMATIGAIGLIAARRAI